MKAILRLIGVLLAALVGVAPAHAQIPPLSPWAVGGPVIVFPASAVNGGGIVTSPQLLLPDGTASLPALAPASLPTLGLYKVTNFGFGGVGGGVTSMYLSFGGGGALQQNSAAYVGWTATADAVGGAVDLTLYRDAAATLAQRNGTSAQTFRVYSTFTDASNYRRANVSADSGGAYFLGENAGTGTTVQATFGVRGDSAVNFLVNNGNRWTIGNSGTGFGFTGVNPTGGLGYATGAGGAVTQITSRTTGVTLNTVTGDITLFSAAGSATAASFTVTNSAVAATDNVVVNEKSGTNLYQTLVTTVGAGSFVVTFFTTGGTAVDAPVFHFSVIKGASS